MVGGPGADPFPIKKSGQRRRCGIARQLNRVCLNGLLSAFADRKTILDEADATLRYPRTRSHPLNPCPHSSGGPSGPLPFSLPAAHLIRPYAAQTPWPMTVTGKARQNADGDTTAKHH